MIGAYTDNMRNINNIHIGPKPYDCTPHSTELLNIFFTSATYHGEAYAEHQHNMASSSSDVEIISPHSIRTRGPSEVHLQNAVAQWFNRIHDGVEDEFAGPYRPL